MRALANFKRHDILGEYVGIVAPLKSGLIDDVYSMTMCAFDPATGKVEDVANIFPRKFGNWTRFLNHSCSPATNFIWGLVGDQVITTIRAVRDISIFEEITVDYGENYWSDPDYYCLCGSANCIRPPPRGSS